MKIEDLNAEDREFIEIVHELKEHDRPGYFALASCVFAFQENGMNGFPETLAMFQSATKGELKAAIKHLRSIQRDNKYPGKIDLVIEYIRREWLRKEWEE